MELLILQAISIIAQTIICSHFVIKFAQVLGNKKISKKQKIIFYITNFFIILICTLIKTFDLIKIKFYFVNTLFSYIMLFISFKYILKLNNSFSILTLFLEAIFISLTEIISIIITRQILNCSLEYIANSPNILFFTVVIQMLLALCIIKLLTIFFKNKTNFFKILKAKHIKSLSISLIICIVPQLFIFTFNIYNYPLSLLIINIVQTVFVSIVLFIYEKNTIEKDKAETELINTEIHNKTLTGMLDGVRTIKHDYNNIIQALNGYIATQQYDKLKEHFDLVLAECNTINNMGVVDPKIFNDPAIYGVVGTKYFIALDKNIFFDFDIIDDISQINFSKPNLSRILGILLDNAIEATCKLESKDRYIKLEIKYDKRKNADIIRVYNSYDKSVNIDLKKIFEKGESSKKVKSGIGLWEVKKLIKRESQAQIYASLEKKYFVQNIIIEKTDCLDDDDYEYEVQLQE